MDERFQQLRAEFSEFAGDYTPPWGLANAEDFADLTERYGLHYPPSFVLYQSQYAATLPPPDNAFCWVKQGLLSDSVFGHLSIEHAIVSARRMGVPLLLAPFWSEAGNFSCFDTGSTGRDSECPVEFWDHDAGGANRETADFIVWLRRAYQERRSRHHR